MTVCGPFGSFVIFKCALVDLTPVGRGLVRADVAWLHKRLTRPVGGGGVGFDGARCTMERALCRRRDAP